MEELDWDGGAGLGRRAGLRVEELDWGWRSWTRDGRCFLCPRAPLPPLSVWGSTVVLVLNIGILFVIFATYLHFKVIHYLKFRWVFKFGISIPLSESLLLSLMLQRTGKLERERPGHNRGRER